ncbi:MAG TPA: hypothetical protein VFP10_11825 [Candidatus Eisenbacteria bacterium]|nr:hypothetical protein [Candidatus Eisenbacteria bacterium]
MAQRNVKIERGLTESESPDLTEKQREEIEQRFWEAVERIGARNADRDPDEIYREVTEVVEEVRQERYERARRAQNCR